MRLPVSQRFILTVMVTTVSVTILFAAGMLGMAGYTLLLIASCATYVLTCEHLYKEAVFAYLAVTALAFLIVPDKTTAVVYAGLVGHYPLFKTICESRIKGKLTALCVKLLYCNAWLIAAICIVLYVFKISIPTELPVPKWLVVLGAEAVLLVTELVHTFFKWLYTEKLRSGIVPKG